MPFKYRASRLALNLVQASVVFPSSKFSPDLTRVGWELLMSLTLFCDLNAKIFLIWIEPLSLLWKLFSLSLTSFLLLEVVVLNVRNFISSFFRLNLNYRLLRQQQHQQQVKDLRYIRLIVWLETVVFLIFCLLIN